MILHFVYLLARRTHHEHRMEHVHIVVCIPDNLTFRAAIGPAIAFAPPGKGQIRGKMIPLQVFV